MIKKGNHTSEKWCQWTLESNLRAWIFHSPRGVGQIAHWIFFKYYYDWHKKKKKKVNLPLAEPISPFVRNQYVFSLLC